MLIATGLTITPAYADVYVPVDSNGNVVGQSIMCDALTCAADSLYTKLTLTEGQHYVLQGTGQVGIGNNNPNTTVHINEETKVWTVTTPTTTTQYNNTIEHPIITAQPISDTATVVDSMTATIETTTVIVNSTTVTNTASKQEILTTINELIQKIYALLALLK